MAPGTPSLCSTHTLCGSSAERRNGIPLSPGGLRGRGLYPPVEHQDQGGEGRGGELGLDGRAVLQGAC
jgi:hypothetical protein